MSDTNIEWADKSWNPVAGCSIVSPGCHHCYAALMAKRLRAMALADLAAGRDPGRKRHYIDVVDDEGRWTGKLVPIPEALGDPLKWKKPQRIFVNSMSDLFHESVPSEFISSVFGVMSACPQHTFMILTKRADRMLAWSKRLVERGGLGPFIRSQEGRNLLRGWFDSIAITEVVGVRRYRTNDDPWSQVMNGAACNMGTAPLSNVQLGVSAEDQKRADERIPLLLQTPAAFRFVSAEPLLEEVDFRPWLIRDRYYMARCRKCGYVGSSETYGLESYDCDAALVCPKCQAVDPDDCDARLDLIIGGGESGPKSRESNVDWLRSIAKQTAGTDTTYFLKQLGAVVFDAPNEPRLTGISWDPQHGRITHAVRDDGTIEQTQYERLELKHKKGGDPAEWPRDLRNYRTMPEVNRS